MPQLRTHLRVLIEDLAPTGAQLASAAGFRHVQQAAVLHILANGELEDIRLDKTVDLRHGDGRFIIVESDRIYWFTLNGERFGWPRQIISGGLLRKLGRLPDDQEIYLERWDEPDRLIGNHNPVNLGAPGVERFVTRGHIWKLNVQGGILDVPAPTIVVSVTLTLAGFNPDQGR